VKIHSFKVVCDYEFVTLRAANALFIDFWFSMFRQILESQTSNTD